MGASADIPSVLFKPALQRLPDGRVVRTNGDQRSLAVRKEEEAECLMEPIRANVSHYRRLMSHVALGRPDDAFLALVEDEVRNGCGLGPTSPEGRSMMIRRVVAWARANTPLARRFIRDVGADDMPDAVWIETLRDDLIEQHALDHTARLHGQAQTAPLDHE